MSSCFSGGGGRTYAFELDIVKSTSSTRTNSQTSSPSSTLSESSNSALAISTRKPRTPRKRPNQTYNEAAALLSTAYPNVFSPKTLSNPLRKSTAKPHHLDHHYPSDFLLPFRLFDNSTAFLLHNPAKPTSRFEPKAIDSFDKACNSPGEFDSPVAAAPMEICCDDEDDFDAESILDEEIEEGIDSIMGTSTTTSSSINNIDSVDESSCGATKSYDQIMMSNSCYGYPMGLGFGANLEFGFGFRRGGVRPLRRVDDSVNWWSFPTVDVLEISPKFNKCRPAVASGSSPGKSKKKKTKMEKLSVVESKLNNSKKKSVQIEEEEEEEMEEEEEGEECGKLMLKLDYDDVLSAWSDKASPLPEELQGGGDGGDDVSARLAQIDLFTDAGGLREASVLRYKEKRRTRLFSKKIRYQVRKVNADRRPRMKGRFVRWPNCSTNGQRQREIRHI